MWPDLRVVPLLRYRDGALWQVSIGLLLALKHKQESRTVHERPRLLQIGELLHYLVLNDSAGLRQTDQRSAPIISLHQIGREPHLSVFLHEFTHEEKPGDSRRPIILHQVVFSHMLLIAITLFQGLHIERTIVELETGKEGLGEVGVDVAETADTDLATEVVFEAAGQIKHL